MTRKKRPSNDQYKRGYSNGITAAVDALLDDLVEVGKVTEGDDETCKGCLMRREGYHALATRWEFALGIKDGAEHGDPT